VSESICRPCQDPNFEIFHFPNVSRCVRCLSRFGCQRPFPTLSLLPLKVMWSVKGQFVIRSYNKEQNGTARGPNWVSLFTPSDGLHIDSFDISADSITFRPSRATRHGPPNNVRTLFPITTVLHFPHSLLKQNLWISKAGEWDFYSLPDYEISKYFSCNFFKKWLEFGYLV